MKEKIKVKCPSCGQFVEPILYWETDEEGIRDLGWGADPETVRWYLEGAECPSCGETLTDKVRRLLKNE